VGQSEDQPRKNPDVPEVQETSGDEALYACTEEDSPSESSAGTDSNGDSGVGSTTDGTNGNGSNGSDSAVQTQTPDELLEFQQLLQDAIKRLAERAPGQDAGKIQVTHEGQQRQFEHPHFGQVTSTKGKDSITTEFEKPSEDGLRGFRQNRDGTGRAEFVGREDGLTAEAFKRENGSFIHAREFENGSRQVSTYKNGTRVTTFEGEPREDGLTKETFTSHGDKGSETQREFLVGTERLVETDRVDENGLTTQEMQLFGDNGVVTTEVRHPDGRVTTDITASDPDALTDFRFTRSEYDPETGETTYFKDGEEVKAPTEIAEAGDQTTRSEPEKLPDEKDFSERCNALLDRNAKSEDRLQTIADMQRMRDLQSGDTREQFSKQLEELTALNQGREVLNPEPQKSAQALGDLATMAKGPPPNPTAAQLVTTLGGEAAVQKLQENLASNDPVKRADALSDIRIKLKPTLESTLNAKRLDVIMKALPENPDAAALGQFSDALKREVEAGNQTAGEPLRFALVAKPLRDLQEIKPGDPNTAAIARQAMDELVKQSSHGNPHAHKALTAIMAANRGVDEKLDSLQNAPGTTTPIKTPDLSSLPDSTRRIVQTKAAFHLINEASNNGGQLSKADGVALEAAITDSHEKGDRQAENMYRTLLDKTLVGKGQENAVDILSRLSDSENLTVDDTREDGVGFLDVNGELVELHGEDGGKQFFENGKLKRSIDADGTTRLFDAEGKETASRAPENITRSPESPEHVLKAERPDGARTEFLYDGGKPKGRIEYNADKSVTTYDAEGAITKVRLANGQERNFEYSIGADGRRFVSRISESNGTEWRSLDGKTYSRTGANDSFTGELKISPNGKYQIDIARGTSFVRDVDNTIRVLDRTNPNPDHREMVMLNDDGSRLQRTTDGQLAETVDAAGMRTQFTSDAGMLKSVTEADGQIWESTDGKNFTNKNDPTQKREITVDTKDGTRTVVERNADGSIKEETVRRLDGSTITKDGDGRITSVTDKNGNRTELKYKDKASKEPNEIIRTVNGDVSKYTTADGGKTWSLSGAAAKPMSIGVDEKGNVTLKEGGKETTHLTDGWAKVTENGQTRFETTHRDGTTVVKNEQGLISEIRLKNGETRKFEYDNTGKMIGMTDTKGTKWTRSDTSSNVWKNEKGEERRVTPEVSENGAFREVYGDSSSKIFKQDGSEISASSAGIITNVLEPERVERQTLDRNTTAIKDAIARGDGATVARILEGTGNAERKALIEAFKGNNLNLEGEMRKQLKGPDLDKALAALKADKPGPRISHSFKHDDRNNIIEVTEGLPGKEKTYKQVEPPTTPGGMGKWQGPDGKIVDARFQLLPDGSLLKELMLDGKKEGSLRTTGGTERLFRDGKSVSTIDSDGVTYEQTQLTLKGPDGKPVSREVFAIRQPDGQTQFRDTSKNPPELVGYRNTDGTTFIMSKDKVTQVQDRAGNVIADFTYNDKGQLSSYKIGGKESAVPANIEKAFVEMKADANGNFKPELVMQATAAYNKAETRMQLDGSKVVRDGKHGRLSYNPQGHLVETFNEKTGIGYRLGRDAVGSLTSSQRIGAQGQPLEDAWTKSGYNTWVNAKGEVWRGRIEAHANGDYSETPDNLMARHLRFSAHRDEQIARGDSLLDEAKEIEYRFNGGLFGRTYDSDRAIVKDQMRGKSQLELELLNKVYKQEYGKNYGTNWDLRREFRDELSGDELIEFNNMLNGTPGQDYAGDALKDVREISELGWMTRNSGRSSAQIEKSMRDTLRERNLQQIQDLEVAVQQRQEQMGQTPRSLYDMYVKNENLSDKTQAANEIYIKGNDFRTDSDTIALAKLALDSKDIEMFHEVWAGASDTARERFRKDGGEQKITDAFGPGVWPFNSRTNLNRANDYLNYGERSLATKVDENTTLLGDNESEIEKAARELPPGQRELYLRGRMLELGLTSSATPVKSYDKMTPDEKAMHDHGKALLEGRAKFAERKHPNSFENPTERAAYVRGHELSRMQPPVDRNQLLPEDQTAYDFYKNQNADSARDQKAVDFYVSQMRNERFDTDARKYYRDAKEKFAAAGNESEQLNWDSLAAYKGDNLLAGLFKHKGFWSDSATHEVMKTIEGMNVTDWERLKQAKREFEATGVPLETALQNSWRADGKQGDSPVSGNYYVDTMRLLRTYANGDVGGQTRLKPHERSEMRRAIDLIDKKLSVDAYSSPEDQSRIALGKTLSENNFDPGALNKEQRAALQEYAKRGETPDFASMSPAERTSYQQGKELAEQITAFKTYQDSVRYERGKAAFEKGIIPDKLQPDQVNAIGVFRQVMQAGTDANTLPEDQRKLFDQGKALAEDLAAVEFYKQKGFDAANKSGNRDLRSSIEDNLRWYDDKEDNIMESIQKMTPEDLQTWKNIGAQHGKDILDHPEKWKNLPQAEREILDRLTARLSSSEFAVAKGLLNQALEGKQPKMEIMDKLRRHASHWDGDEAQAVRDISEAFKADPGLRDRLNNPRSPEQLQRAFELSTSLREDQRYHLDQANGQGKLDEELSRQAAEMNRDNPNLKVTAEELKQAYQLPPNYRKELLEARNAGGDPAYQEKLRDLSSRETKFAEDFKSTASSAVGFIDYSTYIEPLLRDGKLSIEKVQQLNHTIWGIDEQGSYKDAATVGSQLTPEERKQYKDSGRLARAFMNLEPGERRIATNAFMQGEFRPEDKLASYMEGLGTSEAEIKQVLAEIRNRDAAKADLEKKHPGIEISDEMVTDEVNKRIDHVKEEYKKKYGNELELDLKGDLSGQDLRDAMRGIRREAKDALEATFMARKATEQSYGLGTWLADSTFLGDGTTAEIGDSYERMMGRMVEQGRDPTKVYTAEEAREDLARVDKAIDASIETQNFIVDTAVDAAITAAAIALAIPSVGGSLVAIGAQVLSKLPAGARAVAAIARTATLINRTRYGANAAWAIAGGSLKLGAKHATVTGHDLVDDGFRDFMDGALNGFFNADVGKFAKAASKEVLEGVGRSIGKEAGQEISEVALRETLDAGTREALERSGGRILEQGADDTFRSVSKLADDAIKGMDPSKGLKGLADDMVSRSLPSELRERVVQQMQQNIERTFNTLVKEQSEKLGNLFIKEVAWNMRQGFLGGTMGGAARLDFDAGLEANMTQLAMGGLMGMGMGGSFTVGFKALGHGIHHTKNGVTYAMEKTGLRKVADAAADAVPHGTIHGTAGDGVRTDVAGLQERLPDSVIAGNPATDLDDSFMSVVNGERGALNAGENAYVQDGVVIGSGEGASANRLIADGPKAEVRVAGDSVVAAHNGALIEANGRAQASLHGDSKGGFYDRSAGTLNDNATARVYERAEVVANDSSHVEIDSAIYRGSKPDVTLNHRATADVRSAARLRANGPETNINIHNGATDVDVTMNNGRATISDAEANITGSGEISVSGRSKVTVDVQEGETLRVVVRDGQPDISLAHGSKGKVELVDAQGRPLTRELPRLEAPPRQIDPFAGGPLGRENAVDLLNEGSITTVKEMDMGQEPISVFQAVQRGADGVERPVIVRTGRPPGGELPDEVLQRFDLEQKAYAASSAIHGEPGRYPATTIREVEINGVKVKAVVQEHAGQILADFRNSTQFRNMTPDQQATFQRSLEDAITERKIMGDNDFHANNFVVSRNAKGDWLVSNIDYGRAFDGRLIPDWGIGGVGREPSFADFAGRPLSPEAQAKVKKFIDTVKAETPEGQAMRQALKSSGLDDLDIARMRKRAEVLLSNGFPPANGFDLQPRLRTAGDVPSDGAYRPTINRPGRAQLDAMSAETPSLAKPVADEFSQRMAKVREGWKEDLAPSMERVRQLEKPIKDARRNLDKEIDSLRTAGKSEADIEKLRLDPSSPVSKLNKKWQDLADENQTLTKRINEVAQARRDQLQTEINSFVKQHNLNNPNNPLPEIKIQVAEHMHAAGGYAFGEGVVVLPKADLVSAGGGAGLSRATFHEMVHVQQDMDIIRASIHATTDGGKLPFDAEMVRAQYKESTGKDLSENWLNTIVKQTQNAPPLTPTQLTRANNLAMEIKAARPIAPESSELGNTARLLQKRADALRNPKDAQSLNQLMADLSDPTNGPSLAKHLFGDQIPADVQKMMKDWAALPKDNGLAKGFKASPEAKSSLAKQLDARREVINNQHKKLIDDYAGTQLEREAYGFDGNVREPADLPPLPRATTGDAAAPVKTGPAKTPDQLKAETLARMESESSFRYSDDLKRNLGEVPGRPDKAQEAIFDEIVSHLRRPGPGGGPSLEDQGWRIMQSQKNSPADLAKADYILVNTKTGNYHLVDATAQTKGQNIVKRVEWNDSHFDTRTMTLSESGVAKVRESINDMVRQASPLNVVDHPPPSLRRTTLQDGMDQVKAFRHVLSQSDDAAARSFGASDLQGVEDYFRHKLRQSGPEHQTRQRNMETETDRQLHEAVREMLGTRGGDKGRKAFTDTSLEDTPGAVSINRDTITIQNGPDRFTAKVDSNRVQQVFDREYRLALDAADKLPAKEKSARLAELQRIKQEVDEVKIRERTAARMSRQEPDAVYGKPPEPPKDKTTPQRYTPEEVNALDSASKQWKDNGLDGTKLGDAFNGDVKTILEFAGDDPNLSPADRAALKTMLDNYSPDNPQGVKRVHDYLSGEHDAAFRPTAEVQGAKEALPLDSDLADTAADTLRRVSPDGIPVYRTGMISDELTEAMSLPEVKTTLEFESSRLPEPVIEPRTFEVHNPKEDLKPKPGESQTDYLRRITMSEKQDAVVYKIGEGDRQLDVVIEKEYAQKLQEVRELRLRSERDPKLATDEQLADIQLAKAQLAEHPYGTRVLPEDILKHLDDLPPLAKEIVLEAKPGPADAFVKQDWDEKFESAADANLQGRIRFFPAIKSQDTKFLYGATRHEWSHLLEHAAPEARQRFEFAAKVEKGGYHTDGPTGYSTYNDHENWAVHFEEFLNVEDFDKLHMLADNAPVRTVAMAEALKEVLDKVPPSQRGAGHQVLRNRVEYVLDPQGQIVQEARASVLRSLADSDPVEAGGAMQWLAATDGDAAMAAIAKRALASNDPEIGQVAVNTINDQLNDPPFTVERFELRKQILTELANSESGAVGPAVNALRFADEDAAVKLFESGKLVDLYKRGILEDPLLIINVATKSRQGTLDHFRGVIRELETTQPELADKLVASLALTPSFRQLGFDEIAANPKEFYRETLVKLTTPVYSQDAQKFARETLATLDAGKLAGAPEVATTGSGARLRGDAQTRATAARGTSDSPLAPSESKLQSELGSATQGWDPILHRVELLRHTDSLGNQFRQNENSLRFIEGAQPHADENARLGTLRETEAAPLRAELAAELNRRALAVENSFNKLLAEQGLPAAKIEVTGLEGGGRSGVTGYDTKSGTIKLDAATLAGIQSPEQLTETLSSAYADMVKGIDSPSIAEHALIALRNNVTATSLALNFEGGTEMTLNNLVRQSGPNQAAFKEALFGEQPVPPELSALMSDFEKALGPKGLNHRLWTPEKSAQARQILVDVVEQRQAALAAKIGKSDSPGMRAFDRANPENPFIDAIKNTDFLDRSNPMVRIDLAGQYSWAVPNREALGTIADFAGKEGLVEVGAGNGYWAKMLREMDVDVKAYDHSPVTAGENYFHFDSRAWADVEQGDVTAAALHPDRTLLLSWPPPNEPMGQQALQHFMDAGGKKLVFIGEQALPTALPHEVVTGNKEFHEMLARDWVMVKSVELPQVPNSVGASADKMYTYVRRGSEFDPSVRSTQTSGVTRGASPQP